MKVDDVAICNFGVCVHACALHNGERTFLVVDAVHVDDVPAFIENEIDRSHHENVLRAKSSVYWMSVMDVAFRAMMSDFTPGAVSWTVK